MRGPPIVSLTRRVAVDHGIHNDPRTIMLHFTKASNKPHLLHRRHLLTAGGFAGLGFALPNLLQAEEATGAGSSRKSVIMIFLEGGPSHQDTWDMKPNAPRELRGEFSPIATSVPGIQVCEHLPRLARHIDKFAIVRSIVDSFGQHSAYQCETGRTNRPEPAGGWPSMGAALEKSIGRREKGVPCSVAVSPHTRATGGFFGPAYTPFKSTQTGLANMKLDAKLTLDRLDDRLALLRQVDRLRGHVDRTGMMDALDRHHRTAFDVLANPRLVDALDLERAAADRDRYRRGIRQRDYHHADRFLSARRLVEAGVRYVMISLWPFDTHKDNFGRLKRDLLPVLDTGLTNLVTDLHERGLAEDVSLIAWGEFGRSPKLQGTDGRDHWPKVNSALLAGGGMQTGQVIGATDKIAGEVVSRPVYTGEIFATLYHNCGIDSSTLTGRDLRGRPLNLVDPSFRPLRVRI